jgi:hypothetical protein
MRLPKLLATLERLYGPPGPPHPTDPYEMILHNNCGYPATDASCTKGLDALKSEIGLRPDRLPPPRLRLLQRGCGGGGVACL